MFLGRSEYQEKYDYTSAGYCDTVPARRWATIAVNTDSEDGTDNSHTLVHEMLHVVMADVWHSVLRLLDTYITDSRAKEYARSDLDAKMESVVDQLATAFLRDNGLLAKTEVSE
jgi:hypothetical protein